MFVCVPNEDPMGVILYNVRPEDAEGITMTTAFYEIGIDKEDVSLDQDIVQPALPTKPERYYVNAKVRFRSQILDRIMKASTLSVRMLAWSKQTYHGWDVDLTNGRDKLTGYLASCH
jgi:hypothetical protein